MNKVIKNCMLYSVLGTAFTLTACVDNDKDISIPTDPAVKTVDLKVPADFPWSVADRVKLEVNAPVTSVISVYTDSECSDASLLATLHVKGGELTEMELDMPAAYKSLYVKYPTGETTTTVSKVDVMTAQTTRAGEVKNVASISGDKLHGMFESEGGTDKFGLSMIVSSGTVLFEDNWPNLGDYDFNDLVADYRIETHISAGKEEQYKHEHIKVTIGIRAIGGYLPEKLGLQFLGKDMGDEFRAMRQSFIDRYEGLEEPTAEGLTVRIANPGKMDETPIFYIEGLNALKKGGEMFYNTEKQDAQKVATVSFSLYASLKNNFASSFAFTQASSVANQDFFLVTMGGREIHLRGYEPTSLYTTYKEDVAAGRDVTMSNDKTYATDKNLVWGMKVISDFHFPLETKDIRQAYNPYFAQWVESDGAEADNWFKYWGDNKDMVATW